MYSWVRPPLAGRVVAALCMVVCLALCAFDSFVFRISEAYALGSLVPIFLGLAVTCGWLAILPPRNPALAFVPAVLILTFSTLRVGQGETPSEIVAEMSWQIATSYRLALILLLLGMAFLTRRTADQPGTAPNAVAMPAKASARELRVVAASFVSATVVYLVVAIFMPLREFSLLFTVGVGLTLVAFGIVCEETMAYGLLREDTLFRLVQRTNAPSHAVRMTLWLGGSFAGVVLVATALVVSWQNVSHPFGLYAWAGAGAWLGVALRMRAELARVENAIVSTELDETMRAAGAAGH